MLAPSTSAVAAIWPIPGDAVDLRAIAQAQAKTIANQELLLHAYQGNLALAQAPPPTTGTGAGTGTTLNVAAVTGSILIGDTVTGTGVPAATTIVSQQSGTLGGVGAYTTSQATTSISGTALTFTPGGRAPTWPPPTDSDTLMLVVQQQTAMIRNQTALIQQYQDLMNTSQTPVPPTGP